MIQILFLGALVFSNNVFSIGNPGPLSITYQGTSYTVIAETFTGVPAGNFLSRLQSTPWYNADFTNQDFTFADAIARLYGQDSNGWVANPSSGGGFSGFDAGPYLFQTYQSTVGNKLYANVIFATYPSPGDVSLWSYERTTRYNTLGILDSELIGAYWLLLAPEGPSLIDTYVSFMPNAFALRNALNLQSARTAQGLTYDCTVFDANNMCVSFAGTRSYGNDGIDNTTGALIIAHRPTANIRVGGYVDQTMGTTDSNGLKVKRGSPGYGLFGVWSQRNDGLGTQVRLAANSGSVDIETTRLAIGTAEAGFGQSNIKSNGVQLELSQGYAANNKVIVRPYVGYRQMTNKRAAYTESSSADFPLAYSALKQTTESVLVGSKFFAKLTPKTTLNSNFGLEYDVKATIDNYQAVNEDIGTIAPINMSTNSKKYRPVFSVGVVHALDKTQTVGFSLTHRKEALASSSTWSAYTTYGMLQYSVGF